MNGYKGMNNMTEGVLQHGRALMLPREGENGIRPTIMKEIKLRQCIYFPYSFRPLRFPLSIISSLCIPSQPKADGSGKGTHDHIRIKLLEKRTT
ncbi:hypothetical protein Y032_0048g1711 [Ancylostoma ceylanicum]|uniref:Uncharacterized protein n=1 Tax=Ancylostoma ceylanicum TaxID=53326 RepID=A0A016UBR7_9BILA|nr:hypothetical protein Y032_0048g1711 [Ancylostoma ceylanicum]